MNTPKNTSDYHSPPLPVEQAQRIISEFISPIEDKEYIPLKASLSRVLAEDIISTIDVPFHDNSAMDGYAFSVNGLDMTVSQTLKIAGTVYAGHRFEDKVLPGHCVQIMTGGLIPAGCDTVVQQENISLQDAFITIPANHSSEGDNIRLRGEDVKSGHVGLSEGTLLQAAHLGLLASLGIAEVNVKRRIKVAFFSTGDELCSIGELLSPGEVYDSNRYTLYGMLARLGCEVIDMGVIRDDPAMIRAAFIEAAEKADAVITTGGVSVGAADYTKEIMSELGEIAFWNINMRPGRPMAFGRIKSETKQTYLFGLPGNPVAVMATFYFFVRDALLYLMGTRPSPLPRILVRTISPLSKRRGRTEFQRGILSPDEHGDWVVRTTGSQGSGMLSSMVEANCMIVLPPDCDAIQAGEKVPVVLFEGLV